MKPTPAAGALDATALRRRFDAFETPSFGVEEEVFLVDPRTFDLAHLARELLGDGRPGIKLELPACQAELVTTPHGTISAALAELGAAREQLVGALGDRAAVLACGTHPFAAVEGPVNPGEHYERVLREYGSVARRQLVCGMHVHVALPGAERVLAVYNALRGHLPLIAALAANAPLHDGRDTGLASVRPLISGMLPRQGVPPAFASFEELAADLGWGNATKRLDGLAGWWWELRLHAQLGTIEIRVPDVQTGLSEACAVAAVAGALAAWLAERHDAGDLERPVRSWRIAENRWSAARDGARGELFDLRTGRPRATAELLSELLAELRPTARVLGAEAGLDHAARLIECGGADRQRALLAATGEPKRVVAELVERYAQTGGAPSPAAASGR